MTPGAGPVAAYRLAVAGRVLLAGVGGYAVAALATALLALLLPGSRAEAVSAATLVSFAIMAAVAIWVFAVRSLARAVIGLGLIATLMAGGLWLAAAFPGGVVS
jgi:hypothetical protein